MSSSRSRGVFALLVRVAVFVLVFCGVAEVWFRTVMPASQTPGYYQRQPAAITRFDPFGPRTGRFTGGRLCLGGTEWRINNAGWSSGVDYVSAIQRKRPLIALFGDSYIEGFLTSTDRHIDAYLPRLLPGTASYAFGLSGWYLEQYVAVSRYAAARFQPDVLVVFVDDWDVSDSLSANGTISPYSWQIGPRGTSFAELPPTAAYSATLKSRLAKKSALISYLRYNAKLTLPGMRTAGVAQTAVGGGAPGEDSAAGDAAPGAPAPGSWPRLLPAARFMVDRLCADHPGTPIVFVTYGDRYLPVSDVARTPLFPDARAVEVASRDRSQCSFIDLRYEFSRDWARHHVRFEAADGMHWNAYANRLVARTLADFIAENKLLEHQD